MKKTFVFLVLSAICIISACGKADMEIEEFTNKQGTETTICAHEGCSRRIARSGDTLYCTEHSSICSSCGCYINEGETMCTQCRIDELNSLEPTESQSDIAAYK